MKAKRVQHSRRKGAKADEVVIARRRSIVANLTLQGWTQPKIAEALGRDHGIPTSQPTVCHDIQHLLDEWHKLAMTEFADQKIREVQSTFRAEQVAWENFELSCWKVMKTPKKDAKGKPTGEFNEVKIRIPGDTRWHDQALKCAEFRCKLLGLTRDIKVEQTTNTVNVNNFWEKMGEVITVEDPLATELRLLKESVADAEVILNKEQK